jgi:signal-transduction protein with cAMP-binding, CBS, and nucleotidyltransferase domain
MGTIARELSVSQDDAFEKILAELPLVTYRAGETVMKAGSKSGRLLVLKSGAVLILKDSVELPECTSLVLFSVNSLRC